MTRIITAFLLILSLPVWGQDYLQNKEYQYRLSNGMDILLIEDASATSTTMLLSGRIGPYMEDSAKDGLLKVCFELLLTEAQQQFNNKAAVDGYMNLESFMISIKGIDNKDIKPICSQIEALFNTQWWDSMDVEKAKASALQKLEPTPLTEVTEMLSQQLWTDHYSHMSELATTEKVMSIDSAMVAMSFNDLFCPSLMQQTIYTNYDHRDLRTFLMVEWNDWPACRAAHNKASYVPSYNAMPFTLQNLVVKPINNTTYLHMAQGPSAFLGEKQMLFGMLIEELIGISDTVAMLADSLGLQNIALSMNGSVYASELLLSAQLNEDSTAVSGYWGFMALIDSLADTNRVLFSNADMARAKAVIVDLLQDTTLGEHRAMLLSKHWSNKHPSFAGSLAQEFEKLTAKDMVLGLHKYFKEANYASALVLNDSSSIDAELVEVYCTTDKSILEHVFHFKKNTGDPEDSVYNEVLNEVYQFMRYNKFRLQVVGYSSKAELGIIEEHEMTQYFNSDSVAIMLTSGRKQKNDRIPLELYRVMVVVRYLIDRGIEPERLLGTGIRLPKNDPFIDKAGTVTLKLHYW